MKKTSYIKLLLLYFIPLSLIWGFISLPYVGFFYLFAIAPAIANASVDQSTISMIYGYGKIILLFLSPYLGILFVASIIAALHLEIKNFVIRKKENQDNKENNNQVNETNTKISVLKVIILLWVIVIGVFILGLNVPKSFEKNEPIISILITASIFFIPLILLPLIYLIKELRKK